MSSAILSGSVIGVVGAGAMGTGIVQVAAAAGHAVRLFDVRDGAAAALLRSASQPVVNPSAEAVDTWLLPWGIVRDRGSMRGDHGNERVARQADLALFRTPENAPPQETPSGAPARKRRAL